MNLKSMVLFSLFPIALAFSSNTYAECSGSQNQPSEQVNIAFDVNGYKVSLAERSRLGEWVSRMNAKYAIQEWVTIVGSASEKEANSNALAMKRAVAVTQDALADGLVNAPFQLKTQIYPVESTDIPSAESREVTVQISPGCPHNCCDGK
ncbi:hypothetical protein R69927_07755 [Paraburkholderia domus]|jgi:hypothetical protein|uniref:hypothetical protein n=1 Tax=Paraburkholderia TaxID=1822464 RepID=UPI0019149424|nr:hypothetical protein [Paraburkholderia domus]MBK5054631.1 hypothetical protein [Burkholderia sp. R-70006]MBK5066430.1 hypothetical protein [Burkholderia sp. R-70199]MBK5091776.1 hypothetical protein [Burkholderia sp. R-69927]MBK5125859.1 hypothetical protein [Burkholderia sp. R-69980]MCI0152278.1 hypothetical protein [Paraburkholderia sediminicola]